MRIFSFSLLLILCIFSCSDRFFDDDPENTPENNFEIFWQDYNKYYSFFELKGLNWDSMYHVKRPLVKPNTTTIELFKILGDMARYLEDGHAGIYLGNQRIAFDYTKGAPINRLPSINQYVSLTRLNSVINYGILEESIGYIHISSFNGAIPKNNFEDVDKIIAIFKEKNVKGVIIDVRGNVGGSAVNSYAISSRFYDKKRVHSYVRWKRGPKHDDFSEWRAFENTPAKQTFLNPIVVLTNRQVYSTGESFVLEMKVLPHVTVVGDTTGGGSGYPINRILPNEIVYRIPRWQMVDSEKKQFEGSGIFPDIPVWFSPDDIQNNRDAILERAIKELDK